MTVTTTRPVAWLTPLAPVGLRTPAARALSRAGAELASVEIGPGICDTPLTAATGQDPDGQWYLQVSATETAADSDEAVRIAAKVANRANPLLTRIRVVLGGPSGQSGDFTVDRAKLGVATVVRDTAQIATVMSPPVPPSPASVGKLC